MSSAESSKASTLQPQPSQRLPRADLEAYAAALTELSRRKADFPLYFFEPNPKLVSFHGHPAKIGMLAGGNRSGKTEHLVAEACAASIGYRPWILRKNGLPIPSEPFRRPDHLPPEALVRDCSGVRIQIPATISLVSGLAIQKGIGEALHPKVMAHLGPEGGPIVQKVYWSHANTPSQVVLRNGSRILYASAQQKGLSFEATNHSWYGIDEPIPKRVYTGIRRGSIDQAAPIRFTFTPLGQNAPWMFRELYRHADGKEIAAFNISIFDNPWLPPGSAESFAQDPTISDVEKEARLYGKFLHLVDRLYPQFDEAVHIIPDIAPEPHWYIGQAIDPHTVRPWAMAWFTITPQGDIIFFREWPAADFTKLRRDTRAARDYVSLIREIEGTRPADYRLIDPNYGPRTDYVRGEAIPSVKDVLAEYGLFTHWKLNDNLEYGEARVRALLAYNTNLELSATNKPRLFFCESCHNLINAMLFYCARNRNAEDDMPDEQKRDETFKDFADLVRYTAISQVAEAPLSDSFLDTNLYGDPSDAIPDSASYGF